MRALIITIAALALVACATPPATPMAGTASGSISGFATIARWGTYEMELAPAYTRLAALRHGAAQALSRGRITVATAIEVQEVADVARASLDAARRGNLDAPTDAQRAQLTSALQLIERGENLVKESKQ